MNDQHSQIIFQEIPLKYKSEADYFSQSLHNPIKLMYSQLRFHYLKCEIINNKIIEQKIEKLLQDFLKNFKFITYDKILSTTKDKTGMSSSIFDVVICCEENCLIIESINSDLLAKILQNSNSSQIDVNQNEDVKEEIQSFIGNYANLIKNKQFVMIRSIISYFIRRFFYPSNFFKKPNFFSFEQQNLKDDEIKQKLLNCYLKDKNSYNENYSSFSEQICQKTDQQQRLIQFKETDFIKLRFIGSTNKSTIYLVVHINTLFVFAMKYSNYLERENDFYTNCSNRCLLKCYGFVKNKNNSIICGIYDFMSNGSLSDFINNKKVDYFFSFTVMNRLFQGIEYLHSNNFIHRDLNPTNVLVDHDFLPFISDFDTIKSIKNSISIISTNENSVVDNSTIMNLDNQKSTTNNIGLFQYASPEQMFGSDQKLTFSTDIYSYGQIIYFVFEKKAMINSFHLDSIVEIIKSIPKMKNTSKEIENFCQQLVLFEPNQRLSLDKIKLFIYEQLKTIINQKRENEEETSIKIDNHDSLSQFLYEEIIFQNQISSDDIFNIGYNYFIKEEYTKSLQYLGISAKLNNPKANFYIGEHYFKGLGVQIDNLKAIEYYQLAAEQNYLKSYIRLAHFYLVGEETFIDSHKAIECYKLAASQYPNAYSIIGTIYYEGVHIEKDFQKAKKYFEIAAENNNCESIAQLGIMYYEGIGVDKDLHKAKEYFERAAKNGDSNSLFHLGLYFYWGHLNEINHEKAIDYFLKAAEKENSEAYFYLGEIYRTSYYIPRDYSKSLYYYQKAVDLGLIEASTNIGYMYYAGEGLERNVEKSIKYFDIAAQKGNSIAQFNIGDIYFNGDGVKKDFQKAIEYFKLASKKNKDAAFNLGLIYFYGKGVEKNYLKAFKYFNLYTDHPPSLYFLSVLYQNGYGVDKDVNKSIELLEKSSSIENYTIETHNDNDTVVSEIFMKNNYLYPSVNDLGLIYLLELNNTEKAREYISNAGCSIYYYGKNNFGLFNQYFLNDINKALAFYEVAASDGNFALAEYNIGFINEINHDLNSAIEHYKKALDFINLPLKYKENIIEDERFDISNCFIACFINLKLTKFFLDQSNLDLAVFYILNAVFHPLFIYLFQNKKDSLLFHMKKIDHLKDFFLNFPIFNLFYTRETEWSFFKHDNNKVKSVIIQSEQDLFINIDLFQDKKKQMNSSNFPFENTSDDFILNIFKSMNIKNQFKIIENDDSNYDDKYNFLRFKSDEDEIERILKYPKQIKQFFIQNLSNLNEEINNIIFKMSEIVHKPPYSILFGRIKL